MWKRMIAAAPASSTVTTKNAIRRGWRKKALLSPTRPKRSSRWFGFTKGPMRDIVVAPSQTRVLSRGAVRVRASARRCNTQFASRANHFRDRPATDDAAGRRLDGEAERLAVAPDVSRGRRREVRADDQDRLVGPVLQHRQPRGAGRVLVAVEARASVRPADLRRMVHHVAGDDRRLAA